MMKKTEVPYADYGKMHDPLRAELDAAWRRVMDREWFISGEDDRAFESAFAAFCGAGHCVGVGNGLDALVLILKALGVGEGDEVIVPAYTYTASVYFYAITYIGGRL